MSFQASPDIPVGSWKKVAMVTEIEVMHGVSNVDFYLQGLIWLSLLQSMQSDSSKNQH